MFSHFLHIFSSVSPKRIKRVFYKIKYSELMFFIYVCVKKQMNYTTYLFDFDYTLADSSRGIVTCFRNVLNRHGYTRPTDNDIKRTIGKTLEESFSILSGVTDTRQLAEFKKEYIKEADTHMTVNTVLFLETKSVLAALKDSGARIGIISTKFRYRIKELLDRSIFLIRTSIFPKTFLTSSSAEKMCKRPSRHRKGCCLPSGNSMPPRPKHYTSATVR